MVDGMAPRFAPIAEDTAPTPQDQVRLLCEEAAIMYPRDANAVTGAAFLLTTE